MSTRNIIRAWKDEQYRQSLTAAEKETMPANPAGLPELSDAQLRQTAGGTGISFYCTEGYACATWWYECGRPRPT